VPVFFTAICGAVSMVAVNWNAV